jgi:hypothetical protein
MIGRSGYYIVFFCLGSTFFFVFLTQNTEKFTEGSAMPVITYNGNVGKKVIEKDSTQTTVIIWFHPDCEHCLYQLDIINKNFLSFHDAEFFFFTDDEIFPEARHLGRWPNLTSADNVRFGIIERFTFENYFGSVMMPSFYIFNKKGKLTKKIFGEIKIQKLLELINMKTVPEQNKAVLNNTSSRG